MGYIVYTDPSKQAIEIRFSHKYNNENYSSLMFNDTDLQLATILKHLGLFLDSKLDPNYWYYEKNFFNLVKKKLTKNIQVLHQT